MPENNDYNERVKSVNDKLKDDTCTSCEKLDFLRSEIVGLKQQKNKYWSRPCWRDWPCLFTQHRSNIDEEVEKLKPVEERLERECSIHMKNKMVEDTLKILKQNTESKNDNHNTLIHVGGDHITNVQIPETPKP